MKMLACLGTYFALLAYEVAFDKHCAAFQLAGVSSSAGLFKSTNGEIDREKKERGKKNGIGTRWRKKRRMKQVHFLVFPPLPLLPPPPPSPPPPPPPLSLVAFMLS